METDPLTAPPSERRFAMASILACAQHPLQTPGRDLITDAASQIGVVEKLKERGKEISNDSVAEKMLDL